jgi:hypothetical protein
MTSKLQFPAVAICVFLASLTTALAQPVPPRAPAPPAAPAAPFPIIDPRTGLPVTPTIDPATGKPPEPQWIDPNWRDPGIVLTNVAYDRLPLSYVVRQLRESFDARFDILPLPNAFGHDWGSEPTVQLQMKYVRATDIFNAMNLVFENDRTPVRWVLTNSPSGIPYALLRVLPEAAGPAAAGTQRMVYYVGDLVGDEKSGGMTMDQITKTITDIWPADFGTPEGVIQFHKDAQLLVINGTPAEIEFIHQTLAALKEKVQAARPKTAESKEIDEVATLIKSLKSLGNDTK